jgi:peptidoglycan/LPS O-acetylase OafA/YrhL
MAIVESAVAQEPAAQEPIPVGVRRSAHYFPEIESLRGIAILLVFFHHTNGWVKPLGDPPGSVVSPLWAFIAGGQTGVSLFFVLSGFLLSLPFIAEAAREKRVRRLDYYARRALRILPLYYAAVLVGTVLSAQNLADLVRGVPYLFFLNSFPWPTPLPPYSNVWWSLATEVQFYLVLPLLPLFLRSRTGQLAGIGGICVYSIFLALFLTGRVRAATIPGELAISLSVFGRGFFFLFGGVAAWIYFHHGEHVRERLAKIRVVANGGADLGLMATCTALALLLRWQVFFGYWNAEARLPHLWHVVEGILWTAVVLLLLLTPLRMKPIFSNKALSTVGILSYSLYLVHVPMIQFWIVWLRRARPGSFVGWTSETTGAVLVLVVASLALSAVTYRIIERPFLRRKARIDR